MCSKSCSSSVMPSLALNPATAALHHGSILELSPMQWRDWALRALRSRAHILI